MTTTIWNPRLVLDLRPNNQPDWYCVGTPPHSPVGTGEGQASPVAARCEHKIRTSELGKITRLLADMSHQMPDQIDHNVLLHLARACLCVEQHRGCQEAAVIYQWTTLMEAEAKQVRAKGIDIPSPMPSIPLTPPILSTEFTGPEDYVEGTSYSQQQQDQWETETVISSPLPEQRFAFLPAQPLHNNSSSSTISPTDGAGQGSHRSHSPSMTTIAPSHSITADSYPHALAHSLPRIVPPSPASSSSGSQLPPSPPDSATFSDRLPDLPHLLPRPAPIWTENLDIANIEAPMPTSTTIATNGSSVVTAEVPMPQIMPLANHAQLEDDDDLDSLSQAGSGITSVSRACKQRPSKRAPPAVSDGPRSAPLRKNFPVGHDPRRTSRHHPQHLPRSAHPLCQPEVTVWPSPKPYQATPAPRPSANSTSERSQLHPHPLQSNPMTPGINQRVSQQASTSSSRAESRTQNQYDTRAHHSRHDPTNSQHQHQEQKHQKYPPMPAVADLTPALVQLEEYNRLLQETQARHAAVLAQVGALQRELDAARRLQDELSLSRASTLTVDENEDGKSGTEVPTRPDDDDDDDAVVSWERQVIPTRARARAPFTSSVAATLAILLSYVLQSAAAARGTARQACLDVLATTWLLLASAWCFLRANVLPAAVSNIPTRARARLAAAAAPLQVHDKPNKGPVRFAPPPPGKKGPTAHRGGSKGNAVVGSLVQSTVVFFDDLAAQIGRRGGGGADDLTRGKGDVRAKEEVGRRHSKEAKKVL